MAYKNAAGRLLSIGVIAVVLSVCTTLRVGSDFDRSADFSSYHAFSWLPRTHYDTRNPLVPERAREAIQSGLAQKGFTYTNDAASADILVDFTIGARERMDISSYPAPYAGPWFGGYPWWGYPYWGNEVDVRQYREGTLSIDVFDARTHKPVWHGWARKELTQADLERSEAPIRQAVQQVLENFPPK